MTVDQPLDGTAGSAIALAVARLSEEIATLPPFSERKAFLVEQRSKLLDVASALRSAT